MERARDGGLGRWPLIALVALAALVSAFGLAKVVRRRARYLTRDPRRLASGARAELADWLRDQGIELGPGATLRELAITVESRLGVSARAFAAAACAARYGPPSGAAEAAREARRELRLVLSALRERMSPRRRLRGFLALRSLGRGLDNPGSLRR